MGMGWGLGWQGNAAGARGRARAARGGEGHPVRQEGRSACLWPAARAEAGELRHACTARTDFHGISVGSRVEESVTVWPLILRPPSTMSQVPLKRPWTVSCSRRYFMYSGVIGELMCLSEKESRSMAMRTTWRPMRPKPLTPSLIGASEAAIIGVKPAAFAESRETAEIIVQVQSAEDISASGGAQRAVRCGC